MNRRDLLTAAATLPFLGWFKPGDDLDYMGGRMDTLGGFSDELTCNYMIGEPGQGFEVCATENGFLVTRQDIGHWGRYGEDWRIYSFRDGKVRLRMMGPTQLEVDYFFFGDDPLVLANWKIDQLPDLLEFN